MELNLTPVREDLLEGCEVILPEIGAELCNMDGALGKVVGIDMPFVYVEITSFLKEAVMPIEDGLGFVTQVAQIDLVVSIIVIEDDEKARMN